MNLEKITAYDVDPLVEKELFILPEFTPGF
jgi:hypothetical protein